MLLVFLKSMSSAQVMGLAKGGRRRAGKARPRRDICRGTPCHVADFAKYTLSGAHVSLFP